MQKSFFSKFLRLRRGSCCSDARHSQQTVIFQNAIVICISNGCVEVLKRTRFFFCFRTHHQPQIDIALIPPGTAEYGPSCFTFLPTCDIPQSCLALTGKYLVWHKYQISRRCLYQNATFSVMLQITPFHKGSIMIICRHMHILSERFFSLFSSLTRWVKGRCCGLSLCYTRPTRHSSTAI